MGCGEMDYEIETGTTVASLATRLQADYPELQSIWPRLAVAVDGELADTDTLLQEGSEVALLPPVSGGVDDPRADIVDQAIDMQSLIEAVGDPACGAVLLFIGNVRDQHEHREVDSIVYDAYRSMALSQLEAIAADLEDASGNLRVRIVHRLGEIPVGEASVAIAVASPHRAAAYETSRAVLERLKREVPIWKQEHYSDGGIRWREEEPLG